MDIKNPEENINSTLIFICITAGLFYYAPIIKETVTKQIMKRFSPKKVDLVLAEKMAAISQTEEELNKISPTSEFAAYFKKDRQLNKLRDELKEYVNSKPQEDVPMNQIKMNVCIRLFFNFIGFALLYAVAGFHAFCMDSWIFWPVNHMLRFPSVFSSGDVCGGSESGLIPVSYFVVFYLLTVIVDKIIKGCCMNKV